MAVLGYLYAALTLLTFAILYRARYFRLFPVFRYTLAAMAAYAVLTVALPGTSRLNRYLWTPVEVAQMALVVAAIWQALWEAYHPLQAWQRICSIAGIALSAGSVACYALRDPAPARDWYWQAIAERQWLLVGISIWAFSAAWVAVWLDRRRPHQWPRIARLHLLLLWVASLRSLFGSLVTWGYNERLNQALQIACCLGWLANANLIGLGRRVIAKLADADPRFRGMSVRGPEQRYAR